MNIRQSITALILAVAAIATAIPVRAQEVYDTYKFDIGGGIGMSGYLGDANESNLFKHPGFSAHVQGHYLFTDNRFALRAQLGLSTISGNTSEWTDVLPQAANYEFSSTVYDLTIRGEFNFFAYGIGETYKRLMRWSPYMAVGLGGAVSSGNGKAVGAFCIPLSLGVRYKLRPRINLSAEFTMTKTFSDAIDSPELQDLHHIKCSWLKNTDWISNFQIAITYEFSPRCRTCQRLY